MPKENYNKLYEYISTTLVFKLT